MIVRCSVSKTVILDGLQHLAWRPKCESLRVATLADDTRDRLLLRGTPTQKVGTATGLARSVSRSLEVISPRLFIRSFRRAVQATISFQWVRFGVCAFAVTLLTHARTQFFWGYSIAFGPGGPFIGSLKNFGLMNVLGNPSPGSERIPAILYALYQCQFATVTSAIIVGATAERGRVGPALVFVFIWSTLGKSFD